MTEAEFEAVRRILGQDGNPRPQGLFDVPFRGLIKCGGCGSSITAHFKEQVRCTGCRYKFSVRSATACPKCRLPLTKMRSPSVRHYVYYHCTRSLNRACRQRCVSAASLAKQVAEKLKDYGLPAELRDWGMKYIAQLRDQETSGQHQILAERQKAHALCVVRLENLVKLKTAPENANGELLSDEEYQKQRAELLAQRNSLAGDPSSLQREAEAKERIISETLETVAAIHEEPKMEDVARRKELLAALGSNHALTDKKLEIKPEFPFCELPRSGIAVPCNPSPIEPENTREKQSWNGRFGPVLFNLVPVVDEGRTKALKTALERIWKTMEPASPIFHRYPFVKGQFTLPSRTRGAKGRYLPIVPKPENN